MNSCRKVVVTLAALSLTAVIGTANARAAEIRPAQTSVTESQEWEMLSLINGVRAKSGVAPLAMQVQAHDYARLHASDMSTRKQIWHDMALYQKHLPESASIWGENVAVASSMTEAHTRLLASPGHLKNILETRFNYVGIAVWRSGGRTYVSQNFLGANGLTAETRPVPATTTTTTAPASTVPPAPDPAPEVTTAPAPPPPVEEPVPVLKRVDATEPAPEPERANDVPVLKNVGSVHDKSNAEIWKSIVEQHDSLPVLIHVAR